jgi:hypothetical protein
MELETSKYLGAWSSPEPEREVDHSQ